MKHEGWVTSLAIMGAALIGLLLLLVVRPALRLPEQDNLSAGSSLSDGPRGLRRLYLALVNSGVPVARMSEDIELAPTDSVLIAEPWRITQDSAGRRAFLNLLTRVESGASAILACTPEQITEILSLLGRSHIMTLQARAPAAIHAKWQTMGTQEVGTGTISVLDKRPLGFETVAAVGERPLVITTGWGQGHLTLWSDASLIENARIDSPGVARLLLSLMARGQRILIDDSFTQATIAEKPGPPSVLYDTRLGQAAVAFVLVMMAAWAMRSLRPGGPKIRALPLPSSTALITAMGDVHLAADRSGSVALQMARERIEQSATRRWQLPNPPTPEYLAGRLALLAGSEESDILRLLRDRPGRHKLAATVCALDDLRKEWLS